MPRIKDDIYAVIIGQNNRIIEVRTMPNRRQAYKAKNKLLTKYGMFCYEWFRREVFKSVSIGYGCYDGYSGYRDYVGDDGMNDITPEMLKVIAEGMGYILFSSNNPNLSKRIVVMSSSKKDLKEVYQVPLRAS